MWHIIFDVSEVSESKFGIHLKVEYIIGSVEGRD